MRPTLFALCVAAFACANSDDLPSPGRTSEPIVEADQHRGGETARPGPTRADREGAQDPPVAPPDTPARLELRGIDAQEAEDGRGNRVPAVRPIALDVIRESGWAARALVPTLHIGQLQFHASENVDDTTIRFIAADSSRLPREGAVFVQWGEDTGSRVDVTANLEPEAE
jgi:hypothetical protein